jgi:capsular polysaccharide transport system permease protein
MLEGLGAFRQVRDEAALHGRVIWALLMRELSTRYGRNNIGFLWLIGEPLTFAAFVVVMWAAIKPPFEHGVRIIPFVVTGYMSTILVRHMVQHGMNCVKANTGLLYHRHITVMHLFIARLTLEFIGVSFAFLTIFTILLLLGQMSPPPNLPLVYEGWVILAGLAVGLALIFGALAELFEFMERIVGVITYIMVPLSGTFYMAAWIPPGFRRFVLMLPFIHPVEMMRSGFFGEFVQTYYSVPYALAWAGGLIFTGLLLVQFVRQHVEVE